ncbi:MAG: hypothetical protein IT168_23360 [Bryobacterales bacterium]|nr:hypothetical protein [Bryobacterales bacterium]
MSAHLHRLIVVLLFAIPAFANVVWNTPSTDSSGSMPLGNGDIGVNVWFEPSGDLLLYISKTDAWDENGRLVKLGRVRVSAWPKQTGAGKAFRQELKHESGEITVDQGGLHWRIWVDANNPVVRIQTTSPQPVVLTPRLEVWRNQRRTLGPQEAVSAYGMDGGPEPIVVEPDTVLPEKHGKLVWYHRNPKSIFPFTLRHQGLATLVGKVNDPLIGRTFGGAVTWGANIVSIHAVTAQTATPDDWLRYLDQTIEHTEATPVDRAYAAHQKWWADFWNRSWIRISGSASAETVNQGYALQRFMNAAAGRGAYPIKFNGSIFNVDAREPKEHFDADYRRWGGPYWFQNTRLPYWGMLAAGDFDLMRPLFKMYTDALMLSRVRTKVYFQHEGAFFPETMYFWGAYANSNYGWNREGKDPNWIENTYIRYHYNSGLELVAMMHDYWLHTADQEFREKTMLPIARDVVRFFDNHYLLDDEQVLRMEPSQALETYQKTVNPMPDVAGLHWVISRLRDSNFYEFRRQLPALPIKNGILQPAVKVLEEPKNSENPELYAVFPFRLIGVGKPSLELGQKTYFMRRVKDDVGGWRQDPIDAAYLGLTAEARQYVERNFAKHHAGSRFPAFWGPNFDWIPDQDHGNANMIALQRMLLQADDPSKIYLLPAWPREWDVDFKLHAPGGIVIHGVWRQGEMKQLDVTPTTARKAIVLPGGVQQP